MLRFSVKVHNHETSRFNAGMCTGQLPWKDNCDDCNSNRGGDDTDSKL
jgi:hypothetical protein